MILYYFDARLSCFFCEDLGYFCLSWKTATIFLDFFARSWKNLQYLANFAKNNCHDGGKRNQKSKKFLHKEIKTPSTVDWSSLRPLFRFVSCSLEEKSLILFFMTKTCKNHISRWLHFGPYLRYGKQNLLLKSISVFTPCLPSDLL